MDEHPQVPGGPGARTFVPVSEPVLSGEWDIEGDLADELLVGDWPSGPRPGAISPYETLMVPGAGGAQGGPAAWAGPVDRTGAPAGQQEHALSDRWPARDPMAEPPWSPSTFAIASFVFPGMGQRLNGQLRKAKIFRASALLTLVAADMLFLREPMLASLPPSFPLGPAGTARILSAAVLAGVWLWALGAYDAWVIRAGLADGRNPRGTSDNFPG